MKNMATRNNDNDEAAASSSPSAPKRSFTLHWALASVAVLVQAYQTWQVARLECPCKSGRKKKKKNLTVRALLNEVAVLQGRAPPFSLDPSEEAVEELVEESVIQHPIRTTSGHQVQQNDPPRAPAAPAAPAFVPPQEPAVPQLRNEGFQSNAGATQQRPFSLLEFLLQSHPRGIGMILGVGKNPLALDLLQQWHTSPGLYLVDPFIHIYQGYDEPENLSDWEHQRCFEDLRNRIHRFEGRYSIMRDFSQSFAITWRHNPLQQPPPPLSLVYVDNNPSHAAVLRDLADWWGSLGPKGIIAGPSWSRKESVRQAVTEFSQQIGAPIQLFGDGDTWFLQQMEDNTLGARGGGAMYRG
ncbi:unnamed protein product [Amoebophrya sp. A25]|nr:unnamed protein product [Amoebophrya sp. A25]|eukprot:GSA25T00026989001.1